MDALVETKELIFVKGLECKHYENFWVCAKVFSWFFKVVSRPSRPIPVRRQAEKHWAAWKVNINNKYSPVSTVAWWQISLLATLATQHHLYIHSYLVRESDRKPGSYVLSYFGKTGINHFRYNTHILDQLRDQVFIQFLQSYCGVWGLLHWGQAVWQSSRSYWLLYAYKVTPCCWIWNENENLFFSDLLKHERLAFPVPPPEPVNDKKRMVAILPYTKMPDTDEITFQVKLILC